MNKVLKNREKFIRLKESKEVTETPDVSNEMGIAAMFINLIQDSWGIIDNYNAVLATLNDVKRHEFDETIMGILADKNKEIGILQGMLEVISPNASNIDTGKKEAEKKLVSEALEGDSMSDIRQNVYINGDLSDFDPRSLMDKVLDRKESLHSNRSFGDNVYHITFNYPINSDDEYWVDIVLTDEYNDNQQRVFLRKFENSDDAVNSVEEWKEQTLNND